MPKVKREYEGGEKSSSVSVVTTSLCLNNKDPTKGTLDFTIETRSDKVKIEGSPVFFEQLTTPRVKKENKKKDPPPQKKKKKKSKEEKKPSKKKKKVNKEEESRRTYDLINVPLRNQDNAAGRREKTRLLNLEKEKEKKN